MTGWEVPGDGTRYTHEWGEDVKEGGLEEWIAMYESGVMCQRFDEMVEGNVLSEDKFRWVTVGEIPGCVPQSLEP